MLERIFKLKENGTTVKVELLGGMTTFLTMAYIIFVNPGILSTDFAGNLTGLSFDAAMLATCLAAALATLLMGILANYPIALAPGRGFFLKTTRCLDLICPPNGHDRNPLEFQHSGRPFPGFFVSQPIVKLLYGKGKEVSWVIYLVAALLIARYLFVNL